jgi:hypothetical protein
MKLNDATGCLKNSLPRTNEASHACKIVLIILQNNVQF